MADIMYSQARVERLEDGTLLFFGCSDNFLTSSANELAKGALKEAHEAGELGPGQYLQYSRMVERLNAFHPRKRSESTGLDRAA